MSVPQHPSAADDDREPRLVQPTNHAGTEPLPDPLTEAPAPAEHGFCGKLVRDARDTFCGIVGLVLVLALLVAPLVVPSRISSQRGEKIRNVAWMVAQAQERYHAEHGEYSDSLLALSGYESRLQDLPGKVSIDLDTDPALPGQYRADILRTRVSEFKGSRNVYTDSFSIVARGDGRLRLDCDASQAMGCHHDHWSPFEKASWWNPVTEIAADVPVPSVPAERR